MQSVINSRNNGIEIYLSSKVEYIIGSILDRNFGNMSWSYKRWYATFNLCVDWYRGVLQSMSLVADESEVRKWSPYESPIWSNGVEIGKFYCQPYFMNKEDGKCAVFITDANFEPFKKGRIKLLMESALDRHIRRLLREYASRNALISESRGKRIIRMNEQGLRRMVGYIVQRINEDTAYSPIRTINEKFYNPKREAMIDGKLGDYDVLDGALSEKTVEDLKDKGWVEDVRMYANPKKGGKTYALYRRCDNHKYFFAEIYDDKKDDKYLHARVINHNDVPSIILNDANSLIQRN